MEEKKTNPYNKNNKLITHDWITSIFASLDLDFEPIELSIYQKAFVHRSYNKKRNGDIVDKPEGALPLFDYDNERLEFLGDSVLSFVVADHLYERFEDENEGFLSRLRTKLVNGEALAYFAQELDFGPYIIMSRHVEDMCEGRSSVKLLEDTLEAFIGAIYLDFNSIEKEDLDIEFSMGVHVAKEFINALIDSKVDFADLILNDYNFKDQLMKYFQQEFQTNPKYQSNCDSEKVYHADVLLNGEVIESGEGETRKKAEQDACRRALIKYGCIDE